MGPERFAELTRPVVVRGILNAIGRWRIALAALVTLAAVPLGAPTAHARDAIVTSFDGTPINTHFFPGDGLSAGERAPTLMYGPGWGLPGETNTENGSIAPYLRAGYNVVTWDPRGFWGSGGKVNIDSPHFEARDASAIVDFIARQPEAALQRGSDPLLGMTGSSYGGGIQFITAARDPRVDVIAPTIAWNQLTRALLGSFESRDAPGPVKVGWGLALAGLGVPAATVTGVLSPAGVQTGDLAPQFYDAITSGAATGTVSPATRAWFADHGPDRLLGDVRVPTLITQGTVDTLFTLEEADRNFRGIEANGVPLKMIWFCGGHGVCRTGSGSEGGVVGGISGDDGLPLRRKLAWFDRYLRGDDDARVGPVFEWVDEAGRWHESDGYPLAGDGAVAGRGAGRLTLLPGESLTSGFLIAATPDPLALDVPIQMPPPGSDVVGAPRLKATYRATGAGLLPGRRTYVYAQLVDQARNVVVNNFATPIPITLDGQRHTVELDLERIASRSTASGYRLELTQQTNVYDAQRAAGSVDFESVEVTLPLSKPVTKPELALTRRCVDGGKLRVRVTGHPNAIDQVRDVAFKFDKRSVSRDTKPSFERTLSRRTVRSTRAKRLRAVAYLRDGEPVQMVMARTLPRCR